MKYGRGGQKDGCGKSIVQGDTWIMYKSIPYVSMTLSDV